MVAGPLFPASANGLPKAHAAVAFAERLHAGQTRAADGEPFILHPLEVAVLLYRAGAADDVIAAGALHDTLEKTDAEASDLRARFGRRITTLVEALSEDQHIRYYTQRKAALLERTVIAGPDALSILAADKISKIRELRAGSAGTSPLRRRRLRYYLQCLELLEERMPDTPLVSQLREELEGLPSSISSEPLLATAH